MIKQPSVGAVANALITEGATNVYTEAQVGVHLDHALPMGALVLHHTIDRDGVRQYMTDNQNYGRFTDSGIQVVSLDRQSDGKSLPVYTQAELDKIDAFARDKHVLTTLEEYPLGALLEAGGDRPIVPNLYRSGAFKADHLIADLKEGLRSGRITGVTVDADASKAAYVERGIPESAITVIHNGIDTDRFVPSEAKRASLRRELGISKDDPTVLLIGRDSPEKDIPLFLKSARHYLKAVDNGHVVMAGTGLSLDNPNIAELVERHFGDAEELKQRLHALGIRDAADLYPAADVLALTSATESRPLCISEAQASGLGVAVSTAVGDAPSMIGTHGFITGRNPEEIADRWQEAYAKRDEIGFPLERRDELGTAPMIAKYARAIRQATN